MLLPVQPEALVAQCLHAVFVLKMSGVLGNGQKCPDAFPARERGFAEFPEEKSSAQPSPVGDLRPVWHLTSAMGFSNTTGLRGDDPGLALKLTRGTKPALTIFATIPAQKFPEG